MKELFDQLLKAISDCDDARAASWKLLQADNADKIAIEKAENERVNTLIHRSRLCTQIKGIINEQ